MSGTWVLAVDFGTSNTAAAYRVNGGPAQPVRLSDQAEQMPSAVLALVTGVMVGGAAVRSARLDPQRFEPSPKRRLGEGEILLGAREWPVTQLIAEVLTHVRQKAMWVAGGQPPQQLILTYPQQWARGRQESLRRAAGLAGFDPATVRLVTEPIAAATWYASTQPVPAGKCVAVFDFGGGTCDVAVLRSNPGSNPDAPGTFTVLAADGVDPLGGELLDLRLLEWTLGQLTDGGNRALVNALTAPENLGAMLTLKEQVRHAKHELAEYESARIPVAVGSIQAVVTITSAEFDRVVGAEIDEAVALTRRALVSSGVAPAELHALYLTGGSSHLRLVHRKLTELLGRPPATLNDPKLVVAQGALLVPVAALEQPTQQLPRPTAPVVLPTGPVGMPTGPVGGPSGPGGRPPFLPGFQPVVGPGVQPAVGLGNYGPPPVLNQPPLNQPPVRKPKWLIPAIAAALVAVVAIAVVLITGGRDDPDPNNAGGSSAIPTTSTTSTRFTNTSTSTSTTTSTSSQFQQCANGATVGADATCPTDEPVTCWDGSEVAAGSACPALTGQAALEWIFPVPQDWTRTCSSYTESVDPGEAEVYFCEVDKLAGTYVYLSRWNSTEEAKAQFDSKYGTAADFELTGDNGTPSAQEWSSQTDSENDPGEKIDVRAVLYKNQPFSMLLFFSDPTGAGAQAEELWNTDQLYQAPDAITAFGVVP